MLDRIAGTRELIGDPCQYPLGNRNLLYEGRRYACRAAHRVCRFLKYD
jgi:hypothetical protein